MSADLFAEFGYGASTSQPSHPARQTVTSQGNSLIAGLDAFEDATPSQPSRHLNEPHRPSVRDNLYDNPSHVDDFGDFELPQPGNDNDVLFDAALETFSDDGSDDWGDFESAQISTGQTGPTPVEESVKRDGALNKSVAHVSQNKKSHPGPSGTVDLLDSLDDFTIEDKPTPQAHGLANTLIDDKPTSPSRTVKPKPKPKPKLPVEEDSFEDWGDFDDGPVETIQSSSLKVADQAHSKKGHLAVTSNAPSGSPQVSKRASQSSSTGHVRPTNIPPPSILLELFPQLFDRLRKDGAQAKRSVQQQANLQSTAQSIIYTLKAVARVVAGRTLRWKRDAILSQSMRIGPARSGKTGGMKLSTVNKNEDIKEQQEAVDVISMWRDRAALFNSVIQAAGMRPVQVIVENTRVMTAPASQGAIKASHSCALCGLKRDERIPKLDENVEDSFGEWWTEHWGHTECRQFWEENMGLLGQR